MATDPLADLEALEAAEEAAAAAALEGTSGEPPPTDPPPAETLILGKFKTADDAIAAYAELEREHTRTRQELANDKRMIEQYQRIADTPREPERVDPNEQQYLPNGTPYYSDEQLSAWMQQAMDNQDGNLAMAVAAARSERDLQINMATLREELRTDLAPTRQRQEERDAQETFDELTNLVGADMIQRNADQALEGIKRLGSALDGATPKETAREVARYIRGLDAEKGTTPAATPPAPNQESRVRDPRTGKFVSEADARSVHVEGGSGPQPTPAAVEGDDPEDDDIRELLAFREGNDLFGKRA